MASSGFLDSFEALGAALGSAADAVLTLRLEQIDEDPDNPRRRFDEAELQALAQTIAERGMLQPVVVRPASASGRYLLRFGARRFRAARLAGLKEIPALVRGDSGGPEDHLIEQVIENDQREGLSTAELADAVEKLLSRELNQAEIARRLGRPRPQIAMLAAVKSMAPELRALAPLLGARTLYELHAAWKKNPASARRFLANRRPEAITQAEARELAGRTAPRRVRDPSDGSVRVAEPDLAPPPHRSVQTRSVRGAAVFEVTAPGLKGTLVLDDVADPSAEVMIHLPTGERVAVAADKVRILRVRPG